MRKKEFIVLMLIICFFTGNIYAQKPTNELNIIPLPVSVKQQEGNFIISGLTKVYVTDNDEQLIKIARDFAQEINTAKHTKLEVIVTDKPEKQNNIIVFSLSENAEKYGNEGYSLEVNPQRIHIVANKVVGAFYAVQTIYQLLPYQIFSSDAIGNMDLILPCVKIFDKPRFAWRGDMLDVSRHFISIDYLKKNLDYLASLKMNKFHWHLTDDQGWRIEIKTYPRLTDVGAWRVDRNQLSWHNRMEQQPDEKATYGGYYTQEQIKDIIEYANERFIEIIPEIDIPGHSRAAIASYPEISCDEADYKVATGGIMNENTYCPGKEVTFEFTENMLNEVMELFPSKYMHIGGDECNKDKWKICDHCQKRIKDNDLADEHELQSYFIKRVEKIINAKGKTMIGWDEILEGGLAPNATVMSWRGTEGGIIAAKDGHDVVMSPNSYCYLDLRQGDPDIEPDYGYGKLLLSTAYSYNPIPEGFSDNEAKHILGVQGNLWGETMTRPYDHNYMLFPRLYAIAEVGWTPYELKEYDDFIRRTEYAFNRLDAMHVNYAPSMYNVKINHEGSILSSDLLIQLTTDAGNVEVRYTLDGSDPDVHSNKYSKAFPITNSVMIKAQAFKNGKPIGRMITKEIKIHKAAGKKVEYIIKPSSKYNTSELCLTDCIRGTSDYSRDFWVGFQGTDADMIIDLKEEKDISHIMASFMHSTGSWIYLPTDVLCEISSDGKDYITVGEFDFSNQALMAGKYLKEVDMEFDKQKVRYIRLRATGVKENPDWHPSKGGKCWIFMDEIIVN
jgi:hexosaminidase